MKEYYIKEDGSTLFVGNAREIKALAGSLRRAEKETAKSDWLHNGKHRTNISAAYLEHPKFNIFKPYGLEIDKDGYWCIRSIEDVCYMLGVV